MPIDIDRFEDAGNAGTVPTSQRIVRFLAANIDRAFTRSEIADAVDAAPETVGTNLTRLKDRGLVRHREPYWAFPDDQEHVLEELRGRYGQSFVQEVQEELNRVGAGTGAEAHRETADALVDRVESEIDAVAAVYLFGSVASDGATADSDVDLLVVVSPDADYAATDDRLLDVAYDVQLEYGVRIEVHSMPADEFADRSEAGDPFVRSVLEEGERRV